MVSVKWEELKWQELPAASGSKGNNGSNSSQYWSPWVPKAFGKLGPIFLLGRVSCSAVSIFQPKKRGHTPAPASLHIQLLEGRGMDKITYWRSFLLLLDSPVLRIRYFRSDKYRTLEKIAEFCARIPAFKCRFGQLWVKWSSINLNFFQSF